MKINNYLIILIISVLKTINLTVLKIFNTKYLVARFFILFFNYSKDMKLLEQDNI